MKLISIILSLATLGASAHAQNQIEQLKQHMEQVCEASLVVRLGPDQFHDERVMFSNVARKINETGVLRGREIGFGLIQKNEINAWTVNMTSTHSIICVPIAMVQFVHYEGELAAIMTHETGHILNNDQGSSPKAEFRADAVGLDILIKAGYSPFDAAAAMGRFEMYSGDIHTDSKARTQFKSDTRLPQIALSN